MLINHKKNKSLKKKRFKVKSSERKIKIIHFQLIPKIILMILLLILKFSFKSPKTKAKAIKVCLCAIAKKENLYIKFYLDHYKQLGYDHIYLYDNNDINDEKIEDVIQEYLSNNYVTLIDYRGYRGKRENPQMDAYYDCYEKHSLEYDWLSFFDLDEYLILKPEGIKIQEFLENERYKDCPIVKVNWILYSDNDQIKYEPKPFTERFTKLSKSTRTRTTIKSIMRGNITYSKFHKTYNPHYLYYNIKSCSSSGKPIRGTCFSDYPDYEYASLNHYIKTMPEFVEKMKRGLATEKIVFNKERLRGYFNCFFRACDKTEEKVKIFNDAFNTSFS